MELPFTTLDVFTTTPFKGNPLAVVTIPADLPTPPTQSQKQAIAAEFNLSETVFIHEAPPGSDQRKIDIFVIDREIPFAGHPTIGAAVSVIHQGVRTLVAKAGPIEITKSGERDVEAKIPHNVRIHAKRVRDLRGVADLDLSRDPTIRQAELDAQVVSIVNGMTFILVELPSLAVLAAVQQSSCVFPTEELLDEGWRDSFIGRYYYVRTGGQDDDVVSLRTRLIEKSFEDPATGSAASALCSAISLASGVEEGTTRYEVTQGVEMRRESNMVLRIGVKESRIDTVRLAGTATQVMRGFITL